MRAATHKGHCQACGSLQKLPKGVLAKHGYTVTHGFFSGVCQGSGHPPIEVSCALVQHFINNAAARLSHVVSFQAELRVQATEPKAWFNTRNANPRGYGYSAVHIWRVCDISEKVTEYPGGAYSTFSRNGDTAWVNGRNEQGYATCTIQDKTSEINHDYKSSLLDVATKANATYAAWLQHEVDSLRRYITWQTERVNSWKPGELLPVDAKDKQGFVPDEPAY